MRQANVFRKQIGDNTFKIMNYIWLRNAQPLHHIQSLLLMVPGQRVLSMNQLQKLITPFLDILVRTKSSNKGNNNYVIFFYLGVLVVEIQLYRSHISKPFDRLLGGNYPKNITFFFVIDCQENYNFEQLKDSIEKMKRKYDIQFIALAVVDAYPTTLNSQLRDKLHNQNASCIAAVKIPRPIYQQSSQRKAKSYIQGNQRETSCLFITFSGGLAQQTNTAFSDEPLLRVSDGSKLKLDCNEIIPIENPMHISLRILYSLQYQINQAIAWKSDQIQVFQNIYRIISSILSKMKIPEREKIKRQDIQQSKTS
ncbi:unnamed protein product [Paramecium octaurelia]|uniref:Uncharacterized protein n=1 Tax=Paramecium octaurelia TaxID=43137 RepID=A0A8S1Y6Q5_PAROT|nr:unnamed protein product [Paramecium octaurelia]